MKTRRHLHLLSRTVLLTVFMVGCQGSLVDQERIEPFLDAAAQQPEFVGAGIIDDGTKVLVTVHGDPSGMADLARRMVPPGTAFEVRVLAHGLADLASLAERIVLENLSPPTLDANIAAVDVDELRGVVVVGVINLTDEVRATFVERYGQFVIVERMPPGTLF